MRIDILAIGSRGDVQPYVALALGLRRAGFQVRLVTLKGFEDRIAGYGFDHLAIADSPQELAQTEAGRAWVRERKTAGGYLKGFVRLAESLIEEGVNNYWSARQDVDAIVTSPMSLLVGMHLAERLGVPLIQSQFAPPVLPTRYDWDGRRSFRNALRGGLKTAVHLTFQTVIWSKLRKTTNAVRRRTLNLEAMSYAEPFHMMFRRRVPLLAAYSPAVCPRLPDWGDWIHVTGYWFLDEQGNWQPPEHLAHFLDAGPPPVFVGFGSTPFPNPGEAVKMVVQAVVGAGCRGIVVAGGSGLPVGDLHPDVLSIDSVPHDWLFPRVAMAVHHGGAGVTGAALRAGLPSVVVPIFADQPFWAGRIHHIGAGPSPIPAKNLTAQKLQTAIREAREDRFRRRARALGEAIRLEDGVGRAVERIESICDGKRACAAAYSYAS